MATFISISANVYSFFQVMRKGLLDEYFRTTLFTIYNPVTLETKVELFKEIFNKK